MSKVLVIFLDGIGIGEKDPVKNPFFSRPFKFINEIFGETPHLENQFMNKDKFCLFPVDPLMGVEGIPQSGTGQASILCGVNAPEIIGQHFGPFPHSRLIPVIRENNLFAELKNAGKKVCFANAYPQRFFDYLNSGKRRIGVFARSIFESKIAFNGENEVRSGKALTAEITNRVWREKLGYNLKVISPRKAANNLLNIATENDFTLYEFFLTDHLGHSRIKEQFDVVTSTLDKFLFYILSNIPPGITILICSDHGNFEDLSIKKHTFNPALTITAGDSADSIAGSIRKLYDIKDAIKSILI